MDPQLKNFKYACTHKSKKLNCCSVSLKDIQRQREIFYGYTSKIQQDQKLCHFMSVCPPHRRRKRDTTQENNCKPKSFHVFYYFRTKVVTVPVCKKFIMAAFNISAGRIRTVAKFLESGQVPKEKRGGDRVSNKSVEKKNKVKEFIASLPASESHYNRKKSSRIYISCDLNINKLFEMYNNRQSNNLKVSLTMFKNIFYNNFNIGFKSPACDVCGTCLNLKHAISKETGKNKIKSMTDLRIHKLRANAFYKLAKESPPKSISFAFDLQQVHPLPKTPIQDAFYLRQISFYAFCCVDMNSKHPSFYTWDESQAKRGSTEIGSALLHHLRTLDLADCDTIRLFCDGCAGQNKNSYIMHILAYWLLESPASIRSIIIHFPVRGHSYLPADRAFGRVEKLLKKKNVITTIDEYNDVYGQVGNVNILGKDWFLCNIKKIADELYHKIPSIKNCKRIELKKFTTKKNATTTIKYKTSEFYRFVVESASYTSMVKRGKSEKNFRLEQQALGNEITKEKKQNVQQLLEKQFDNKEKGLKWEELPELAFFKNIIFQNLEESNDTDERTAEIDEEVTYCDCLETDCGSLHV